MVERNELLPNASQLAFVLAIVLFALALISEQVAALRFDRSERRSYRRGPDDDRAAGGEGAGLER